MVPRRPGRPATPRPGTPHPGTARPPVGTLAAVGNLSPVGGAPVEPAARVAHQRRLVADLCRMLDPQPGSGSGGDGHAGANGHPKDDGPNGDASTAAVRSPLPPAVAKLSPRMRQTLERLLSGDSEKEIAARFDRSRHTVHVYVKKLYERFGVSSRGELLARFVRSPVAPLAAPPLTAPPLSPSRAVT